MTAARQSLRQRESGRWQARWYDDAGNRGSKMFATKTEATKFLNRVSADRQRGDYLDPRDARLTLEEIAGDWLLRQKLERRPKTYACYESLWRLHVQPSLGSRPVGRITTHDVRLWIAERTAAGVSPSTLRNAYRVLQPILGSAVERGGLRTNPCSALGRRALPRIDPTEQHFLTAKEVESLADTIAEPYGVLIHFAARTGMRAGEIAALRMKRVDLLRGRVRVAQSLSEVHRDQFFLPPKTGEARDVVLPPTLTRLLREYLSTQPPKGPEDFLFTGDDSADPAAPVRHNSRFYPAVFLPAVRRAGLTGLRFHDLRHTCAALLIAENVPAKAIQRHLGHASFAITMDTYGHLFEEADDAVSTALERAFTSAGPTPGLVKDFH